MLTLPCTGQLMLLMIINWSLYFQIKALPESVVCLTGLSSGSSQPVRPGLSLFPLTSEPPQREQALRSPSHLVSQTFPVPQLQLPAAHRLLSHSSHFLTPIMLTSGFSRAPLFRIQQEPAAKASSWEEREGCESTTYLTATKGRIQLGRDSYVAIIIPNAHVDLWSQPP